MGHGVFRERVWVGHGGRVWYGDGRMWYGDGRMWYGDGRMWYGDGRMWYGDGRMLDISRPRRTSPSLAPNRNCSLSLDPGVNARSIWIYYIIYSNLTVQMRPLNIATIRN
jgi:hypothetical protein